MDLTALNNEKEAKKKDLSFDQMRQEEVKPVLDDFKKWLNKKVTQTPAQGLLGKTVTYTLNQWDRLVGYLEDGRLQPDNNFYRASKFMYKTFPKAPPH